MQTMKQFNNDGCDYSKYMVMMPRTAESFVIGKNQSSNDDKATRISKNNDAECRVSYCLVDLGELASKRFIDIHKCISSFMRANIIM